MVFLKLSSYDSSDYSHFEQVLGVGETAWSGTTAKGSCFWGLVLERSWVPLQSVFLVGLIHSSLRLGAKIGKKNG